MKIFEVTQLNEIDGAKLNAGLSDLMKQLSGEPGSQGIDADDPGAQKFSSPSKKGPMSPGKKPAKKSDLMKQLGGEPGSQGIDADDPGKKPTKKPASPGGMRAVTGAGGSDDDAEARLNNLPGQTRAITTPAGKNQTVTTKRNPDGTTTTTQVGGQGSQVAKDVRGKFAKMDREEQKKGNARVGKNAKTYMNKGDIETDY